MDVLGIDVSKADFHACLIQGSKRSRKRSPNVPAGHRQVENWLKNRRCSEVHACMEATGSRKLAVLAFTILKRLASPAPLGGLDT